MLQGVNSRTGTNIPDLNTEVTRSRGEDILSGGIKHDLTNLPRVTGELGDGGDIGGLLGVGK